MNLVINFLLQSDFPSYYIKYQIDFIMIPIY